MPDPLTLPGLYKPSMKPQQAFGVCIYGRGGVGKTTLLGTMPGRGLVIDVPQVEGGTLVLEPHADRIDVFPVHEWDEINAAFWFLNKGEHDYNWVGIDSITAFQELAKRKTVKERDLDADPNIITLQDWGKIGQLVGEMIYRFRTLKQHTIWVAQERRFDQDGPLGPDVTPGALNKLLPSMLMVGRLSLEYGLSGAPERHLRVHPHQSYYAKVRASPQLDVPAVIKEPHLGRILQYIFGKGKRPDEVQQNILILS